MRSRLLSLPILVLAAPLFAQREDDLLVHWRLTAQHLQGGAFHAVYGQPPLVASAAPRYLGQGENQALLMPEKWGLLTSAEASSVSAVLAWRSSRMRRGKGNDRFGEPQRKAEPE